MFSQALHRNASQACQNCSFVGNPLAIDTTRRRTVTRTLAPIFSSRSRIVMCERITYSQLYLECKWESRPWESRPARPVTPRRQSRPTPSELTCNVVRQRHLVTVVYDDHCGDTPVSPSMHLRSRKTLLNLALLCVGLLSGLLLLEGLTRWLIPDPDLAFENRLELFAEDPQVGFRNRGNYHAWAHGVMEVRTNALGFRGPEVRLQKSPGTKRILGLGDSVAFGTGVR